MGILGSVLDRTRPKLLVLGGSGFLGAHVVRQAVGAGFEVTNACRQPEATPDSARGRAREVAMDLVRGFDSLPTWLDEYQPEAIVNCAALSRAAACERDLDLAMLLNARIPGVLASWSEERGVKLVHVSTDLVFGGEPSRAQGYSEEDEPAPMGRYASTKQSGESSVAHVASVARLPLLYGDSDGRGLGASDSVIAAVERGETPSLFSDELRTPLDVEEAAAALLELAGTDHAGILHVAGPRSLSRLELGILALGSTGRSEEEATRLVRACLQAEVDAGAPRPRDVSLDSPRARSLLQTRLSAPEERQRPPTR